jgi:hypothetical protein
VVLGHGAEIGAGFWLLFWLCVCSWVFEMSCWGFIFFSFGQEGFFDRSRGTARVDSALLHYDTQSEGLVPPCRTQSSSRWFCETVVGKDFEGNGSYSRLNSEGIGHAESLILLTSISTSYQPFRSELAHSSC